ncbi:MAG: hypothetical protein HY052_07820 [Proteobacteria bacterium]|nr:hypothetical protein [Pseudomonadota bacterium]
MDAVTFDMLSALGFTEEQIEEANIYCCGTLTLEGAPHLKPAHLAVFDCLAPPASLAVRRVSPEAQIKMQAAVETFISGAVSHTVVLNHYTTIEEVKKLILMGWELGIKNLKLYRDGCSLLHPGVLPLRETETGQEEEGVSWPKQSVSV